MSLPKLDQGMFSRNVALWSVVIAHAQQLQCPEIYEYGGSTAQELASTTHPTDPG